MSQEVQSFINALFEASDKRRGVINHFTS